MSGDLLIGSSPVRSIKWAIGMLCPSAPTPSSACPDGVSIAISITRFSDEIRRATLVTYQLRDHGPPTGLSSHWSRSHRTRAQRYPLPCQEWTMARQLSCFPLQIHAQLQQQQLSDVFVSEAPRLHPCQEEAFECAPLCSSRNVDRGEDPAENFRRTFPFAIPTPLHQRSWNASKTYRGITFV